MMTIVNGIDSWMCWRESNKQKRNYLEWFMTRSDLLAGHRRASVNWIVSQWLHMEFFSHTVKIESESSSKTTASIHHLMQVASSKFNLRVKANTDTDSSRMLTSRYCSFVVTIQGCFSNYVWMMHRWWSWIVTSGKKWGDSRTGSDHLVDLYWTYSYWLFNWSSTLSSSFGEVIRKNLSRTLILFNFLFYPPISFLLYRSKLSA